MPQIAQRLREPAAFVLLAYAGLSTLFHTVTFLFAPDQQCVGSICDPTDTFSRRAVLAVDQLLNPVVTLALVGAVVLAHLGTQMALAKIVSLAALVTAGIALLFGVVAVFASFGADGYPGWDKTQTFFVGAGEAAVLAVATWLVLGYFQKHAPAKPAPVYPGQPPQGFQQQWQQPGQWQQPQGQPQQQPQAPQQQPQGQPQPPQQWGQPQGQPPQPPQQSHQPQGQPQPPQQSQPWGPPPPPAPPSQQGFAGGVSDSMMTQAIPAMPPAPQPPPVVSATETTPFPPVGNWTSEG